MTVRQRGGRRSSPARVTGRRSKARARSVRSASTCTPKQTHQRLAHGGLRAWTPSLSPLILTSTWARCFREPTAGGADRCRHELRRLLADETAFATGLPAVPDEGIPVGNSDTVRASVYGAQTYGDLCNTRQTLGFVRLARMIAELGAELDGRSTG